MKKKLNFYSIWEDHYYAGTVSALLPRYAFERVATPEEADILVFNGGADIATEIYGEEPIFRGIPGYRSQRDKVEVGLYAEFVGSKFLLGICRGAQLLNCLNGGTLWQDVNNHGRDHKMIDLTTMETMTVTSTHHQMMRPHESAQIIGISNEATDKRADGLETFEKGQDIEVLWYPKTRSLCIQGHPEYVPGSRFANWSIELLVAKYKEQLTCAA